MKWETGGNQKLKMQPHGVGREEIPPATSQLWSGKVPQTSIKSMDHHIYRFTVCMGTHHDGLEND
jgi:hypothetical protein